MHRKIRFPLGLTPGELDHTRRRGRYRGRKAVVARHLKRRRNRFQRRALRRLDDLDPVTIPEPAPVRPPRPRREKNRWTWLRIGPCSWAVVYLDTF